MQDLSFDFHCPVFDTGSYFVAIQFFTFENIYTVDSARCRTTRKNNEWHLEAAGFLWAGGQQTAEGAAQLTVTNLEGRSQLRMSFQFGQRIRGAKLIIKNQPVGPVVNLRESSAVEIGADGLMLRYPNGWHQLATPLAVIKASDGQYGYFRSLDQRVREKRFAFLPDRDGKHMDVELICDESAEVGQNSFDVPVWEVGRVAKPETIYATHSRFLQETYRIEPWETRSDVPAWARDISLVATIHGQHWTGYVFNTYDQVLEKLRWLGQEIEPHRILVYLPGWEGRYYWQYGEYRPNERMGGEAGFRRLNDGAREMGAHLMPMFGLNLANSGTKNFEQWGAPAKPLTAGGFSHGGSVDWDGSRHYDHGSMTWLHPACPAWQNHLVDQITRNLDAYGFDAVILDIAAAYTNDPRWNYPDAVERVIARIRKGRPNLLVSGEGWYDGMSRFLPLAQGGHQDHKLNYHDEPYPALFDTHSRAFAHLCLGDPGRGSTGVHEWGTQRGGHAVPHRRGVIPTLNLVEDSIEKAPDRVREILVQARQYAAEFCPASKRSGQPILESTP